MRRQNDQLFALSGSTGLFPVSSRVNHSSLHTVPEPPIPKEQWRGSLMFQSRGPGAEGPGRQVGPKPGIHPTRTSKVTDKSSAVAAKDFWKDMISRPERKDRATKPIMDQRPKGDHRQFIEVSEERCEEKRPPRIEPLSVPIRRRKSIGADYEAHTQGEGKGLEQQRSTLGVNGRGNLQDKQARLPPNLGARKPDLPSGPPFAPLSLKAPDGLRILPSQLTDQRTTQLSLEGGRPSALVSRLLHPQLQGEVAEGFPQTGLRTARSVGAQMVQDQPTIRLSYWKLASMQSTPPAPIARPLSFPQTNPQTPAEPKPSARPVATSDLPQRRKDQDGGPPLETRDRWEFLGFKRNAEPKRSPSPRCQTVLKQEKSGTKENGGTGFPLAGLDMVPPENPGKMKAKSGTGGEDMRLGEETVRKEGAVLKDRNGRLAGRCHPQRPLMDVPATEQERRPTQIVNQKQNSLSCAPSWSLCRKEEVPFASMKECPPFSSAIKVTNPLWGGECFVNLDGLPLMAKEGIPCHRLPFQSLLSKKRRGYIQTNPIAWGYGEVALGIPWGNELFIISVPFSNLEISKIKEAMGNTLTLNYWPFDCQHALLLSRCRSGGTLSNTLSAWLKFIAANTKVHTICHVGGHEGAVIGKVAADCRLRLRTKNIPALGGHKPSWTLCEKFGSICSLHGNSTRFMREKGLSPFMHCPLAEITAIYCNELSTFFNTKKEMNEGGKVLGLAGASPSMSFSETGRPRNTQKPNSMVEPQLKLYYPQRFEWLEHDWKAVEVPPEALKQDGAQGRPRRKRGRKRWELKKKDANPGGYERSVPEDNGCEDPRVLRLGGPLRKQPSPPPFLQDPRLKGLPKQCNLPCGKNIWRPEVFQPERCRSEPTLTDLRPTWLVDPGSSGAPPCVGASAKPSPVCNLIGNHRNCRNGRRCTSLDGIVHEEEVFAPLLPKTLLPDHLLESRGGKLNTARSQPAVAQTRTHVGAGSKVKEPEEEVGGTKTPGKAIPVNNEGTDTLSERFDRMRMSKVGTLNPADHLLAGRVFSGGRSPVGRRKDDTVGERETRKDEQAMTISDGLIKDMMTTSSEDTQDNHRVKGSAAHQEGCGAESATQGDPQAVSNVPVPVGDPGPGATPRPSLEHASKDQESRLEGTTTEGGRFAQSPPSMTTIQESSVSASKPPQAATESNESSDLLSEEGAVEIPPRPTRNFLSRVLSAVVGSTFGNMDEQHEAVMVPNPDETQSEENHHFGEDRPEGNHADAGPNTEDGTMTRRSGEDVFSRRRCRTKNSEVLEKGKDNDKAARTGSHGERMRTDSIDGQMEILREVLLRKHKSDRIPISHKGIVDWGKIHIEVKNELYSLGKVSGKMDAFVTRQDVGSVSLEEICGKTKP